METVAIQFNFTSNDVKSGLSVEIYFNNKILQTVNAVESKQKIAFNVDCAPGEHVLKFVLKNKTSVHTVLDDNGKIVTDACVGIENFQIDHVALEHAFFTQCRYHHDYNGSQEPIEDNFYGTMGCNGTVVLKFTSPVYRWLVETL